MHYILWKMIFEESFSIDRTPTKFCISKQNMLRIQGATLAPDTHLSEWIS